MYTGVTGALKLETENGYVNVAYISGWSVDESSELIEVERIGQKYNDVFVGKQNWSASADGFAVFESSDGQQELIRAKHSSKKVLLNFVLNKGTNHDAIEAYLRGYGYIESLSISLDASSAANIAISIKGVGPLELISSGENIKTKDSPIAFRTPTVVLGARSTINNDENSNLGFAALGERSVAIVSGSVSSLGIGTDSKVYIVEPNSMNEELLNTMQKLVEEKGNG